MSFRKSQFSLLKDAKASQKTFFHHCSRWKRFLIFFRQTQRLNITNLLPKIPSVTKFLFVNSVLDFGSSLTWMNTSSSVPERCSWAVLTLSDHLVHASAISGRRKTADVVFFITLVIIHFWHEHDAWQSKKQNKRFYDSALKTNVGGTKSKWPLKNIE